MEIIGKCNFHGIGTGEDIDCSKHFYPVLTDTGLHAKEYITLKII